MKLAGVEIFKTGMWPGNKRINITIEDLDSVVESFSALRLAGRVPLKLTHDGPDRERNALDGDGSWDPSKSLAMGWVERIWREGSLLMADFDVPDKVYKLIKEGYLKFVSIEMAGNVQAFNRMLPWVLEGVALLGADLPAVGVLKDLQALTMRSRHTAFRARGSHVTFRRGSQTEGSDMTKEEVEALLKAEREASKLQFGALETRLKTAEDAAVAANKRADEAEKARKQDALKDKRAAIVALFEVAIKAKDSGSDFIEPAVREQYAKFSRYDKDDAACEAVELKDVETYIKDNLKKGDPKLKAAATRQGESDDISGLPPDVQVHKLSLKWCRERNLNGTDPTALATAGSAVLRDPANKDLAAKFQRLHITEGGKAA